MAAGSINGVLSGKHYNQSVRVHKVVYEALMRLLLEQYLESLDADKRNETITLIGKYTKLCYLSECNCTMYCNSEHCASTFFLFSENLTLTFPREGYKQQVESEIFKNWKRTSEHLLKPRLKRSQLLLSG